MIGYATLIAPEISSEIKPGMYIFLLYAHMGLVMYGESALLHP